MLLTGTFSRAVDEKQRIAIPKPLRETLGGLAKGILYVTPGTDGSLAIYTEDVLARLAERLAQASPNGQDVRAFSRLFYARAQAVELDAQGRVRIPPELVQLAGLNKEAVLIGVGTACVGNSTSPESSSSTTRSRSRPSKGPHREHE